MIRLVTWRMLHGPEADSLIALSIPNIALLRKGDSVEMAEFRNQTLHDAFLRYAKLALELISKSLEGGQVVTVIPETMWVDKGNALIRQERERPLWIIVIHRLETELKSSPEYQECTRLLSEDVIIARQLNNMVGSSYMRMTLTAEDILNRFISEILEDKNGPTFDDTAANERYSEIESALYSDEIINETLAPLLGLDVRPDKIQLADEFAIERLTMEEIASCVRFGLIRSGPSENFILNAPRYAVKVLLREPKVIGEMDSTDEAQKSARRFGEAAARITEVVHALRLFKSGQCFLSGVVRRSKNWLMSGSMSGSGGPLFQPPWFTEYKLDDSQVSGFKQFWDRLQSQGVKRRGFLEVAIKRFSYAAERQLPEDQLIDLMISSEALFLCDVLEEQYRGELRYRLGLRAGFFIGPTASERRDIFRLMRSAYDARSAIVHGGKPDLPARFGNLTDFVRKIEEYVREALHKAVVLASVPTTPKYLVDWDELVFSQESNENLR